MKTLISIALAALLAGCAPEYAPSPTDSIADQCLRAQLFEQCMTLLPKGPEVLTGGNDWDEVVAECESSAHRQSIRLRAAVRPECQSY